jgi:predicted metal-dependent phosphoesterase TrpH
VTHDLTVRLTPADQARSPYFYVPFDVPEGTSRIDVRMAYRQTEDCVIDLGCLDPRITGYPSAEGFRGWSGGARDRFFVATDDATPGYIHGPMPAGAWQVILGLYKVPPEGAEVRLSIDLDATPRQTLHQPARTFPVRESAGWYRGDLHCHTFHSDALGAPDVLHAAARQAGLDFLAVCDHNTISQRRYFHPHSSPGLVFVRGMEVTTATGHANVYGVDDWIDFRMTRPSDAHVLARLVHARGGLLSVNHDKPTIPWDYELPKIDCMEVWQSAWMAWNWVSLDRWQQRLAAGLRICAIGGSDFHQPETLQPEGPLVLARPTTVLRMPALSEDNVLIAMREGRGYVTESPSGPHLEIGVDGRPMGSAVAAPRILEATVRGAAGDTLALIDASGTVAAVPIPSDDWRYERDLTDPPELFIRAEIVAEASRARILAEFRAQFLPGELPWGLTDDLLAAQPLRRAIGNPVYIDRPV